MVCIWYGVLYVCSGGVIVPAETFMRRGENIRGIGIWAGIAGVALPFRVCGVVVCLEMSNIDTWGLKRLAVFSILAGESMFSVSLFVVSIRVWLLVLWITGIMWVVGSRSVMWFVMSSFRSSVPEGSMMVS